MPPGPAGASPLRQTRQAPARGGRAAAGLLAFAGVCALHLLAGWGLHERLSARIPGVPTVHAYPIVLARAVPASPAAAPREEALRADGNSNGRHHIGSRAQAPAQPGNGDEPSLQGLGKFYSLAEVDQPASPAIEWQLDTALLRPGTLYHAIVEVLIDQDGQIVRSTIIRLEPENRAARAALARLSSTRMFPARLQGSPVASRRSIELHYGVE